MEFELERLPVLELEFVDVGLGDRLEVAGLEGDIPALPDQLLECSLPDRVAELAAEDGLRSLPLARRARWA
jgi:hypothetical protein